MRTFLERGRHLISYIPRSPLIRCTCFCRGWIGPKLPSYQPYSLVHLKRLLHSRMRAHRWTLPIRSSVVDRTGVIQIVIPMWSVIEVMTIQIKRRILQWFEILILQHFKPSFIILSWKQFNWKGIFFFSLDVFACGGCSHHGWHLEFNLDPWLMMDESRHLYCKTLVGKNFT